MLKFHLLLNAQPQILNPLKELQFYKKILSNLLLLTLTLLRIEKCFVGRFQPLSSIKQSDVLKVFNLTTITKQLCQVWEKVRVRVKYVVGGQVSF